MGLPENHPHILALKAKGMIPAAPKPTKPGKVPLVEASFVALPHPTWVIPLHVTPGDNNRGKAKIGRAAHERRVISRHLGGTTLYHLAPFAALAAKGEVVTITLTRLGRLLDPTDNLPSSFKWVIDTIAMMLGQDDGPTSPLRFVATQEKCERFGVRVELTV